MRSVISPTDSVFSGKVVKTAVRGEAVDFDKYDPEGKPNPFHGWTLDFPEDVPMAERTYSNKSKSRGWYDDPENEPLARGTQWGGTGDYAERRFYEHTSPYSRATDPNREIMDPTGALGQYSIGDRDLNEYHETGRHLSLGDQTEYPEDGGWDIGRPGWSEDPDSRGRFREEGDDDSGRVFGLWHGGHSYSDTSPDTDMESFPSLGHAMRAVEGRYGNYDSRHGGERAEYHPETNTYHLTGNTRDSNLMTPAVDRNSGMDIYHATPHPNGGWNVDLEEGPRHHIWVNADGDAVVGREHGDYGPEFDHEDEEDDWGEDAAERRHDDEDDEEQSSHPVQQHLVNADFEHRPDPFNGGKYFNTDNNGHRHVVRAPNPRYGAMDTWHYEFHPENEQDRDPHAPRDASTDGPRSLSFSARDPEEAYQLHQNLGDDLSELSSRGWGVHKLMPQNAREDNRAYGGSDHLIEAHRRSANDRGYDRILKNQQGWSAAHIPDPTPQDRIPPVVSIASSRSRRDVLDAADDFNFGTSRRSEF